MSLKSFERCQLVFLTISEWKSIILEHCDEAGFKISQGGTMLRTPSKQKASDFKPSKGSLNSHLAALWRQFYNTMEQFRSSNCIFLTPYNFIRYHCALRQNILGKLRH